MITLAIARDPDEKGWCEPFALRRSQPSLESTRHAATHFVPTPYGGVGLVTVRDRSASTTLILGGVRSGKSRLAERLAVESGFPVTYIATATAGDAEMAARIAAHRAGRSPDWSLVEEPIRLAGALRDHAAMGRCLLVECLTLWLNNLLALGDEDRLGTEIEDLVASAKGVPGRVIFVGNETNMGIIPLGELSRRYCDLAGSLHQRLASEVNQVILTVAGLPLTLKGRRLEGGQ